MRLHSRTKDINITFFSDRVSPILLPLALILIGAGSQANSEPLTWNDGPNGATRAYYNSAAKLPWDRTAGDWRDANNEAWGLEPYSTARLVPKLEREYISIDVTELVAQWMRGEITNHGFYLLLNRNTIVANSREALDNPPVLKLTVNGTQRSLGATMDTSLDKSTFKSLGQASSLGISADKPALIWFDLSDFGHGEIIESANLELYVTKIYGNGPFFLNVYRVDPAPQSSRPVVLKQGLADSFSYDKEIDEHPSVYFSEKFENDEWKEPWYIDGKSGVAGNQLNHPGYQKLSGQSLATVLTQGENMGLNIRYRFSQNGFEEPEEAYFRYYLRLGNDWNQTESGGKLPGFAGTYKSAGWGSRRPNGSNGWSARGSFMKTIQSNSPNTKSVTPIGSYVYHMGQGDFWGNTWSWSSGDAALLENNRWYCIEQYVKLNTIGADDGVIRAWVDGRQVFEKTGLQFRSTDSLKIEDVWFNIYHGGAAPSPRDQHAFIDNIVIAREYIGPMKLSQ